MHLSSKPRASFSLALFRLYFLKNGWGIGRSESFGIHKCPRDAVRRLAACPCRSIGNVLPMGWAVSGAGPVRPALVCGLEMARPKAADLTAGVQALAQHGVGMAAMAHGVALGVAHCTASASGGGADVAADVATGGLVSATLWVVALGVHLRRRSVRGNWRCSGEPAGNLHTGA